MVEKDIDKMDLSEIKTEVQRLRDELAKMKRGYDDVIYNLDYENFSDGYVQNQNTNVDGKINELDVRTTNMGLLKNATAISNISEASDVTKIYKVQTKNNGNVVAENYVYYDKSKSGWKQISDGTIYTVFEPKSTGYSLEGNVIIDGSKGVITQNLLLTGNTQVLGSLVWGDIPIKAQYSVDGSAWGNTMTNDSAFIRLSFNGGSDWTKAIPFTT